MPFIMVDEVPDGADEAYAIDRNEYDTVVAQRDELLKRAVDAEDAYRRVQEKYAAAVLSVKPDVHRDEQVYSPATMESLFA